ncbi:MAG: 3'-5' exonuclease [Trueperaceae bacterium]|jgi:DNA polymerase-3 subunit epsilon
MERRDDGGRVAASELPVYHDRKEVPRDLRTREELSAKGYDRLGEERGLLRTGGDVEALYSTSEARLLRDALWPRGEPARRGGSGVEAPGAGRSGAASGRQAVHIPVKDLRSRLPTRLREPQRWLDELFRDGFLVLDTETTGLSTRDEVIEIGVVDSAGTALLETKVFPRSGRVPAASTRVHGYTIEDLRGAPSWPEVLAELESLLAGRRVFAWNAPFDERMVAQSARQWQLRTDLRGFECAMRTYSAVRSVTGSFRLERAALIEGVLVGGQSHTSLNDARLTLAVMRRLRRAAPGRA